MDEEKTTQQNVVIARDYYEGDQDVPLSERQKAFLGFNEKESRFALNYCKGAMDAVTERMIVTGLTSDDEAYERKISAITGRSQYSAPEGMHDDTVIARALANKARLEGGAFARAYVY